MQNDIQEIQSAGPDTLKEKYEYLMDRNAEREFFYGLLKKVFFQEPSQAVIDLVQSDEVREFIKSKGDEYTKASALLEKYFSEQQKGNMSHYEAARTDFVAHYCFGKKQIYPYESMYVSKKKQIFQDVTFNVRDWYFDYDLAPKMLYSDPDDHVGLELDFMMNLAIRTLKSLEKKDIKKTKELIEGQARFLNEHPLKWFKLFAEQSLLKVDTDFYRAFSYLLERYVMDDLEDLKDQYLILESIDKVKIVEDDKQSKEAN